MPARPVGDLEPLRGSIADPEFRRARATRASRAAHSASTYVRQVIARASDLTDEDLGALRALLASRTDDVA